MSPLPPSHRMVLGADLGGTQFRVALVDENGQLHDRHAIPTLGHLGPQAVLDRMAEACREVLDRVPNGVTVVGLGVAAPSPIDPRRGIVYQAPNLPGWIDIPLRDELQRRLQLPILVGNDANLAALGEWRFGAGRGCSDLVFLTFSTGVGSGFICGGKLLVGHAGLAGEAGHHKVLADGPLCSCEHRGCLEAMASGTAIRREAILRLPQHLESSLRTYGEPTAAQVEIEASGGDAFARQLMVEAGRFAGIGIANLLHIFDPEIVVVGGGVSRSGSYWWEALHAGVRDNALHVYLGNLRIVPAALGDDVGIFGAAAAVLDPGAAGA